MSKSEKVPFETISSIDSDSKDSLQLLPPEGGTRAWLTVIGAWLTMFTSFGYLYSFGVYQDYYTRIYMDNKTPSQISWIGGFQYAFPYLCGLISGPFFDRGKFYFLEFTGAIILLLSLSLSSLAKPHQYYQIFLSQGVGVGLGVGLLMTPTVGVISHYFTKRRSLATGIVLTGPAAGGIIYPIILNQLLQQHSFGDTVRASTYVSTGCLGVGLALMRARLPPPEKKDLSKVKRFLKEPVFMMLNLSNVIASLGIVFPLYYLQLYAVVHDVDPNLAFYSITILNAGSFFARIVFNYLADIFNPFILSFLNTLACAASIWAIFGIKSSASLIVVSLLYGTFSGAYVSLAVAAVFSLSKCPSEIGARSGLFYAMLFPVLLTSPAIAGSLLKSELLWSRAIVYSATCVSVAAFGWLATALLVIRERRQQRSCEVVNGIETWKGE